MLVWNTFLNDARVFNEAQTLAQAGYAVTVNALAAPGAAEEFERLAAGFVVRRFGARHGSRQLAAEKSRGKSSFPGLLLLALSRLGAQLGMLVSVCRARPDVVHAHDVNMLPLAWLAARWCRAALVYDAHEISTHREGYRSIRPLVAWLERKIMPRASGTITTTDARSRFFARAYKVHRPLVLQNRPRHYCTQGSDHIRTELGWDRQWPVVIYQGGQQPGRGLSLLVKAMAQVPEAYLVMVGGGPLHGALRAQASELGLEQRVRFVPTVPLAELPRYTASADIGVQPIENTCLNHYTTDSNKLFEYVQAGLPVVASDLPEIRRVVREHDLGVLVPEGDSVALAAALRDLVGDEGKRQYYAVQSRKAASVLNWESQEHELLALYERVLSNRAST
ncbi:glycosyl transferase family 1 [Stutzerimonas stutzeri]|nr:glycosyl transferase family 1 [Stutzerimonas stutzeri]